MPTIELSSAWRSGARDKLVVNASTAASTFYAHGLWAPNTSNPYGYTFIRIYKGTAPAPSTLWTGINQYDSDLLLTWTATPGVNYSYALEGDSVLVLASVAPAAAIQDGTATWFAHFLATVGSNAQHWLGIGTVGAAGSGADLQLPSTSIISGALYHFSMRYVVPAVYTY